MSETKKYGMLIEQSRCINCKACMIACQAENNVPLHKHRNWIEESEVRGTYPNLGLDFTPNQCNHCDNPHCERVCPTGATFINDDGIVLINYDSCIGCRFCMMACPYDARYVDKERGVVDKCTYCTQRIYQGREPACLETCPGKVRTFGDLNDPKSEISLKIATHRTEVKYPETGTKPRIYYIID